MFNVWLIHKFRGLEIYASYGNTNLGFANDMGEEERTSSLVLGTTKPTLSFMLRFTIAPQFFRVTLISLVMRTSRGSVEMCLLTVFSPDVSRLCLPSTP